MPPRTPLRAARPGSTNWAQTVIAPPPSVGAGGACGPLSIFVASSGWLNDSVDESNGYVVLAIYNLPDGAAVQWTVLEIDDGGSGLFEAVSCLDDPVLVIHAQHEQSATIRVTATVNGDIVGPANLDIKTNRQVCT